MRRLSLAALLVAAACAQPEIVEPPDPPRLVGEVSAIGRPLDLEVEGRGTPIRLQGVTGRVTAVCVLGSGGGAPATGAGGGGGAEAAEPPGAGTLVPEADQVLRACEKTAARLADRIAVVGLTTDATLDLDRLPLRTFRDPQGEALRESLDLEPRSQVILADQQGRVAEVIGAGELERLETAAARLVR
ncbi:hypothetical protein [Vulgatibacter sp.]|uniref:hypothetical protein n=1 Tax=Vulgatibacter sp. TaxID=1971226 RepID=UPI0035673D05